MQVAVFVDRTTIRAVVEPVPGGDVHRVLDGSRRAIDTMEHTRAAHEIVPADPQPRVGRRAALLRDRALPRRGAWAVLVAVRSNHRIPQHALVRAPGQDIGGANRGLDHAVAIEIDTVVDPRGNLRHPTTAPRERATIGHGHIAVEVDRGARGLGLRGGTRRVAPHLGARHRIDLGDRALR